MEKTTKEEGMKLEKLDITDRKYAKPISLYPLKPEEALSAFMKVDPKKLLIREQKIKGKVQG